MAQIEFKMKNDEPLLKEGTVIAHQQFELTPYAFPTTEAVLADAKNKPAVSLDDRAIFAVLSANGVKVTFNKRSGYVAYIDVDGTPMMTDESELIPDFWRAATDNDFGAGMQNRLAAWQHPRLERKSFDIKQDGKNTTMLYGTKYRVVLKDGKVAIL